MGKVLAAYLIEQGIDPKKIRILTFTRRAAAEIVTRVEMALGSKAKTLGASTFHSWCMGLIRANPSRFGLKNPRPLRI